MWRKVERTKVQSVSCVPEMSAARLGEIGGEMRGRDWARLGEIGRDEGMRLGEIGRDWARLGEIGRDEGARLGEIGRDCAGLREFFFSQLSRRVWFEFLRTYTQTRNPESLRAHRSPTPFGFECR